jgi:hypothetical protein
MNAIPALFYWGIGAIMHHTQGHFAHSAGPYTILFILTVAIMLRRRKHPPILPLIWNRILIGAVILFIYATIRSPVIIYINPDSPWFHSFRFLNWAALISSVAMLLRGEDVFKWASRATLTFLILAQVLVPILSPTPHIDVFVNNTAAVDYFLHGLNPYGQAYPDIYHGLYDYKPGFLYFPGLLFWLAPFRWFFGDIRYGYMAANFLAAWGFWRLARKHKAPTVILWLAPILWLSFPVTYFVLEQSWIDPLLAAFSVLIFLSLEEEGYVLPGILIGGAFAVKQYGFLIGGIALLYLWRKAGLNRPLKAAGIAAVTFLAMLLPFAIANWSAFFESTVGNHANTSVRMDAFNATIFMAKDLGWLMPGFLRMTISVAGILYGAWIVVRNRKPELTDCAIGLFVSYGGAFLFGKWAFCNYHYLLASFLLMYLVGFSGKESDHGY